MSGDTALLRSRVSLIGNTFSKNMSLLSDEDRARIEREALQEVSAHCSPKAVSIVRYFLTAGTEADFSDVLAFCTDQKDEEIVNFHLALDNLLLMVNRRLMEAVVKTVERVGNGWRLCNSNIECSRTFERGGWLKFCGDKLEAYFEFNKATNQEWTGCHLNIGFTPLFKDKTYCAIDLIQNVFANFVCKVIHFDPSSDKSVFLCGDGEGKRAFCVVLNEKFIFRGDLLSNLRIGDIEQKHNVYLEAQVDSGTFANEQKKVDLKNPGMTFGQACLDFMNGKLDGKGNS